MLLHMTNLFNAVFHALVQELTTISTLISVACSLSDDCFIEMYATCIYVVLQVSAICTVKNLFYFFSLVFVRHFQLIF